DAIDRTVTLDVNANNGYLIMGNSGGGSTTLLQTAAVNLTLTNYEQLAAATGSRATFTQSAGTDSIGDYLLVAAGASSTATYNLSGSGTLLVPTAAGYLYVGDSGVGTFNQSGGGTVTLGTSAITVPLFVGNAAGSNGIYNLSGGSL